MSIRRWGDIGLNSRTTILMVIPMVIAISVFGYFVTVERIESSERNANLRSELFVRHFSSIIELGMIAQDKVVLASYADIMLKEESVVSILIQDINSNNLVKKENRELKNNLQNIKYSSSPVFLSGINVGDIESEFTELEVLKQGRLIGFVRVGVLQEKSQAKQKEILLIGLVSTLLGILISSLISFRISQVITQPVLRLKETVNLLTAGRLSARVKEDSKGEIGALERGINNMAGTLHGAQNQLLNKVEKATNELNLTVLELEQRNIELEKSRLEAEQLGNEKAHFLARMSHELRTPLNAVVGFSRLIGKKISEQDRQAYAQSIINSAEQLTSLIDEVLTFSKLKSGTLNLTIEAFSPRYICENIVIMQSSSAQEKNIELVLLFDENIPDFIDGDVFRINQVLTNLLNNAIKFTESGDIIFNVNCQFSSAGDMLNISVEDTGCGIGPDNINDLFKEFSQLDNSLTRKSDGVGLGLSIAKHLASKMGGDISVNSELNKGSCFSFCIPLLNPLYKNLPAFTGNKLSAKNVLLFESHAESCRSIKDMLRLCDMNVHVEIEVEQVKAHFLNNPNGEIELLVLAFSATQLKNIQYVDIIKEFKKIFDGPVLILAGINGWELPTNFANQFSIRCISKPLRLEILYQNILKLLQIDDTTDGVQSDSFIKTRMNGEYVLIAEDNSFNQEIYKMMFEERYAKVMIVENGNDAITAAANQKFSLILMDLHMPGCDGISAARIIRESDNHSSDAVIILVTADVLSDTQHLLDSGIIDQVLYKPIDEGALDLVLDNYIDDCTKKHIPAINSSLNDSKVHNAVEKLSRPLQQEVLRLCEIIKKNIKSDQIENAKNTIHQLVGVSGYYQLGDVSIIVTGLQNSININNNNKASLEQLDKLYQLISDIY